MGRIQREMKTRAPQFSKCNIVNGAGNIFKKFEAKNNLHLHNIIIQWVFIYVDSLKKHFRTIGAAQFFN